MKGCQVFVYLLMISNGQIAAFLNEAEQKISAAMMETLRLDNRILVEEPNLKPKNLQNFKSHLFWNKATTYQNTNQMFKYFRKTVFPHPPTLIVFKAEKITTIVDFIKTLTKVK